MSVSVSETSEPDLDLLKYTQLDAKISEETAKSMKSIQKLEHRKWVFWVVIFSLIGVWLLITYIRVSRKWDYMIKNISKARSDGSSFDKSGFMVALSLEYPFLTTIRIANPHLPEAIQLAYYSASTTKQMGTGFNAQHDYLHELDLSSQKCNPNSPGWCSAEAIWCSVFGRDPSGKPLKGCFPACVDPSYEGQALNYTSKITGWGINFGFAGHMAGVASKATGPAFGLVGFGVGAALGAWQAYNTHKQQVQACINKRKNCYAPPGTPSC